MEQRALRRDDAFRTSSLIVDFNNAAHVHLLEKAWDKLFLAEFPEEKQQETVADWARRSKDPLAIVSIPIAGENLHDPQAADIKGFAVSTLYKRSGALVLDFNLVAPESRGTGLGSRLVEDRKRDAAARFGKPLNGIYAETQHFERFSCDGNARIIPIDYTLPSLTGHDKDDDLVLLSYRLANGSFASLSTTDQMLVDQFDHYDADPQDADLARMRQQLRALSHLKVA